MLLNADGIFSIEYDYSIIYYDYWSGKISSDQARDLQSCGISYSDTRINSMEGTQYVFHGSKKAFEAAQNMGYFYEMNPSKCQTVPDVNPYNNLGDRILDDLSKTLGIDCEMIESGSGYFVCELEMYDNE